MGKVYFSNFNFMSDYGNVKNVYFLPHTLTASYLAELSTDESNNIYLTMNEDRNYWLATNYDDTFVLNEDMIGFMRGAIDLLYTDSLNSYITDSQEIVNYHTSYANCFNLVASPLSGLKMRSMYGSFYNCGNLIGSPNVGINANNLIATYYNCVNLTGAPQGSLNTTMAISTYYNCVNLIGSPAFGVSAKSIENMYYNCSKLYGNPSNCNNAFITRNAYYNCPNIYGTFYWGYKLGSQADIVNAKNMFYNRNIANKLNIYAYINSSVVNALVFYGDSYGDIYGRGSALTWQLLPDALGFQYYNNAQTNTNIYLMFEPPVILDAHTRGLITNAKFKIPKKQDYSAIYLVAKADEPPTSVYDGDALTIIPDKYEHYAELDLSEEYTDYYLVIFAQTIYGTIASEPYKIKTGAGEFKPLLSSDIAVKHSLDEYDGEIWLAYIKQEDGKIHVKHTLNTTPYEWNEEPMLILPSSIGIKCDIAFDTYIKYTGNTAEFITDDKPCIAYITAEGACNLLDLNTGAIQTIAAENVVDVSLVRSPVIGEGQTDYGFTVFFIAGGKAYYRQRIKGVWYDAEVISIADNNKTYVALEAFCTWDYRTGVQITDEDGNLYQFITYPEGILNQEHHIEFNGISATTELIWGWSAVPVLVENIEDSGNWGTTIRVTFDWPNTESGLSSTMFTLVDDNNINYVCQSCSLNGIYLTLTFDDFNLAGKANDVTLTYTKPSSGGLISPAVQTDSFSETFIPVNLDPPQIDPPTFLSASNSDEMTIDLVLTEIMLNTDVSDMLSHFTITWQEYDWTPGGALHTETRSLATLTKIDDTTLRMVINNPSFTSVIGDITISYDGLGGLRGLGGPASAFEDSFTPTGLIWKGHQNDEEHIEFTGVTANIDLHAIIYTDIKTEEHIEFTGISSNVDLHTIVYTDAKTADEHIEFTGISATVTLTEIHPI